MTFIFYTQNDLFFVVFGSLAAYIEAVVGECSQTAEIMLTEFFTQRTGKQIFEGIFEKLLF